MLECWKGANAEQKAGIKASVEKKLKDIKKAIKESESNHGDDKRTKAAKIFLEELKLK